MPIDPDAALPALFQAFRENDYLNLSLNKAAALLGSPRAEVRRFAEQHPALELQRREGQYGAFYLVRAALTPTALAQLAPVTVDRLRRVYGAGEGLQLLRAALAAGGSDGPFHVAGGEVRLGAGESEAVHLVPAGALDNAPPVYPPGHFDDEDLKVLGRIEDLEAERINFGVYETFVSVPELLHRIQSLDPGLRAAGEAELRASLGRLQLHQYVLDLGEDRFRSRISETVRVLKRVKQRFGPGDADTAPYLVHSVRVHFEDRKRLNRSHPLAEALDTVFAENRGKKVDRARKALEAGFAAALNRDPADVTITRIQRDALRLVAGGYVREEGKGFVITGNTGSGKTEAAVLPLLLGAVEEKLRHPGEREGCKVLLVYPRQELAKNQLQRLCRYLAFINRELSQTGGEDGLLTAGIVFGDTPTDDAALTHGDGKYQKKWEEEGEGYRLPFFTNEQDGPVQLVALNRGVGALKSTVDGFADGGWEMEGFRATRKAVLGSPPDVLVITTEMLHRWLMEPEARRVFGLPLPSARAAATTAPRAVVFDEIHLYDTTHGAQVGMLLRRLCHRLFRGLSTGGDARYPLMIGMSATIGDPKRFWAELSGLPAHLITELSPTEADFEAAQGREYFLFIRPETYSRGKLVGDASVAIQSIMAIAHNLRRRGPAGGEPSRHRTLVFQDSISKIKKLALEFTDAESRLFLARYRLSPPAGANPLASPEFRDGEYWRFDAEDPFQYGERRQQHGDPPASLSSPRTPVFSGNKGTHLLRQDIIFATGVLEVGFDDPAIQFVFQHHAPRDAASFIQKKGRAGRSLQDRPITAVTLSRHSFRDAFYYQNPQLLYDPADHRPPLNVDNFFVNRFQALALVFDELARLTGTDVLRLPEKCTEQQVNERVAEITAAIQQHAHAMESAFGHVAGDSFRRVMPSLASVWDWYRGELHDPEIMRGVRWSRNLMRGHPQLPQNLFGTMNLPTVRVLHSSGDGTANWEKPIDEDISLAFSEFAPGKVSRRYGRGHRLLWRRPDPWVEVERYKPNRPDGPGPFNPALLRPLNIVWGAGWADYLPLHLHRIYAGTGLPDRFYRARYLELWDFGEINPRDPKRAPPSWKSWGELLPNGEVVVRWWHAEGQSPPVTDSAWFQRTGDPTVNPWRRVSPDSNSYSLSLSYVRPHRAGAAPEGKALPLPPLFPGLLDDLRFFFGEVGGTRSALDVWEVHYGAEASIKLVREGQGEDPFAGTGHALVRYRGGPDHAPTLYGYDMVTEGLRVPYDLDRLKDTAKAVFDAAWASDERRNHLQDQYLRYLLKSEAWPAGAADPMNIFDLRIAADLLSTLRAESRAQGGQDVGAFLDQITRQPSLDTLLADVRGRLWRDSRVLNDEFVARLTSTLTLGATRPFLEALFQKIQSGGLVREFLQVLILHSLKHAVRHLFLTEGSTRDVEVGSSGMFRLTHRDWSPSREFFVYERNQDGGGATRLVAEVLESKGLRHQVERWWDVTLACPVGDEEDFLRAALRRHGPALLQFSTGFLAAAPAQRRSPRDFLEERFPAVAAENQSFLVRLAGMLTAEFTFGGNQSIPMTALHLEIELLDETLAVRFHRRPTPMELAGHAASEVEADPSRFPALAQLRDIYRAHAQQMAEHDDEAPSNDLERFMDQVQALALNTCVDACPACLASECNLGHMDVMKHTVSRRHLKAAHEVLSAPFTVAFTPGATAVGDLVTIAEANAGWAVLTYTDRLPQELTLGLRDRFEQVGRIFDHERMELRAILRLRVDA